MRASASRRSSIEGSLSDCLAAQLVKLSSCPKAIPNRSEGLRSGRGFLNSIGGSVLETTRKDCIDTALKPHPARGKSNDVAGPRAFVEAAAHVGALRRGFSCARPQVGGHEVAFFPKSRASRYWTLSQPFARQRYGRHVVKGGIHGSARRIPEKR